MGIGLPRAARLACVLALLTAAPANATDHFVDDTGTGSGACTDPATPCTFNTLSGVGANDTIFVGGGTYAGPLGPGGNISFKASNFHPPQTAGQAIIDGGATQPAITVGSSPSSALGTVQGFVLRSGANAVFAQNNVTLIGNTFDTSAPPTGGADVVVPNPAAPSVAPVIQGNTCVDSSPTDGQEGIFLDGPTNAAHVTGNTFTGFFIGALVGQGGPTISGNTFDQVHANGTTLGRAIGVSNGDGSTSVTMDGNTLKPPLTPGGVNNSIGILLTDQGANTISATLSHNRIFGYDVGVRAADTDLGVSLDGDVIADSATADIRTNDSGTLNATDGNVTAKNITLGGTNAHAILQDSQLTL